MTKAKTKAAARSWHDPLTTREGWAKFVQEQPAAPALLPTRQWRTLSPTDRASYDHQRLAHRARLVIVATPTIRQVTHSGRRLVLLNRHAISARRGLIVTGAAGTGKTTAITQLGRAHELVVRQQHPGSGPLLPVIYVTVPPNSTAKMLAAEFARFLGLPLPKASARSTSPTPSATCSAGWAPSWS
jgi:hypothetical protein